MKVYIGCFGSGLGHASRMLEVARELRARGADLMFSSWGEAAATISRRGYRCNVLPPVDVRYSETGAFQLGRSLLDTPSILAKSYHQLGSELANLHGWRPDVALSDSSLPTVVAAKALRLPAFAVLNQLNLASSNVGAGPAARAFGSIISAALGCFWKLSDEVILPDLPPPYTISEMRLWGSKVGKTRYVGFLRHGAASNPDDASAEIAGDRRPKVFWQVSGPPRTRSVFLRMALDIARALSKDYVFVVAGGDPEGSREAQRTGGGWFYEWCGISDVYFRSCDVVVSRAGQVTIGQAIASSKPSLLVPIPKQPEQEGNADKAARLGASVVVRQSRLRTATVRESLEALLSEGYRTRAAQLGEVARGYDAGGAIVETLEAAARRGRQ